MSHIIEIADDLSTCPYYQGTGICTRGCRTEPECKTCEPPEGWGGYWVTTPTGITAHVKGEITEDPKINDAINAVIEAAYELLTKEGKL